MPKKKRVVQQVASDPSPSEIERRAEEVREKWSARTRESRCAEKSPVSWTPPIIPTASLPTEMSGSES